MTKKYCYICSPYRGNIFKRIRNIRYARELTERAINAGMEAELELAKNSGKQIWRF